MALTLPTNVTAGNTGHISAHNILHQLSNGFIFSSTAFFIPATSVSDATAGHLMLASARNAHSGVAPLDGSGLLPAANLPAAAIRNDQANSVGLGGLLLATFNNIAPGPILGLVGGLGNAATPAVITNGSRYAKIYSYGQYTTNVGDYSPGGDIEFVATEDFAGTSGSPTNLGTAIDFYTTQNGTANVVKALRLDQDQSATFAGGVTAVSVTAGVFSVTTLLSVAAAVNVSLGAGSNIVISATTGTKIGTTTTGKIGFWGATPVAVPTGWGTPSGTLSRTALAAPTYTTTGGTGATVGAFDTAAHRDNVITDLFTLNKTVAALITDLLSEGLIHA